MLGIFSKFLDVNRREVEKLERIVVKINSFDAKIKKLKDKDFPKKTQEFKERLSRTFSPRPTPWSGKHPGGR